MANPVLPKTLDDLIFQEVTMIDLEGNSKASTLIEALREAEAAATSLHGRITDTRKPYEPEGADRTNMRADFDRLKEQIEALTALTVKVATVVADLDESLPNLDLSDLEARCKVISSFDIQGQYQALRDEMGELNGALDTLLTKENRVYSSITTSWNKFKALMEESTES